MSDVDISTNAAELQQRYVLMGRSMDAALRTGMRRLVLTVEREGAKRLRGGDSKPRSYPVPMPTGVLHRSMGTRIAGPMLGFVFNRAEYASAIHSGFFPYGNKKAPWVMGRRFMDDAVDAVDGGEIMQRSLCEGLNP